MRIINYNPKPITAVFQKRYKRFLCDVIVPELREQTLTVHCANSGSMKSCLIEGCSALIIDSQNTERKLRYSLESLLLPDGWACLNTQRANQIFALLMSLRGELSAEQTFQGWHDFLNDFGTGPFTAEAKYNSGTRFDGLVTPDPAAGHSENHWIEIKSVSLRLDDTTLAFPDAVTERGQKHLSLLTQAIQTPSSSQSPKNRATMVYAIMRGANVPAAALAASFRVAHEIDPHYAAAARLAAEAGVAFRILVVRPRAEGLDVDGYFRMNTR